MSRPLSRLRSWLVALVLLGLVPGCAGPRELASTEGIGGTGYGGSDGGIGGTGRGGDDSGIGGTGIYGTVTAFGSVWVNGVRIAYADDVPVTLNGAPARSADLAIGQVVWIEAGGGAGSLAADSIAIVSAVVGPVTELDREDRSLVVAGQVVEIPVGAVLLGGFGRVASFEVGDVLEVSGLRRADGSVVASRIDRADPAAGILRAGPRLADLVRDSGVRRLSIEGYVAGLLDDHRFRIDGLAVEAGALPRGVRPGSDEHVWISGSLAGPASLRAERIRLTAPPLRPLPLGPDAGAGALRDLIQPRLRPPEPSAPSVPTEPTEPLPTPRPSPKPPDVIDRIEKLEPALGTTPGPTQDRLRSR